MSLHDELTDLARELAGGLRLKRWQSRNGTDHCRIGARIRRRPLGISPVMEDRYSGRRQERVHRRH